MTKNLGEQTVVIGAARSVSAWVYVLLTFGALAAADLVLKWWSFETMGDTPVNIHAVLNNEALLPSESVILLPNVLGMKLTLNRGAVFGIMPGQRAFFLVAGAVALCVVSYFFVRSRANHRVLHLALALILAGAIGNLHDRIVYAAVRDMLWLFPNIKLPFGWSWPGGSDELYPWIFNLADVYLLAGIGLIMIRTMVVGDEQHPVPAPANEPTANKTANKQRV